MAAKINGIGCGDGNALYFRETPDYVGVDVTLVSGSSALTVRIPPEAWTELCDRYSGPLGGITCKPVPDDCGPEVVKEMAERIENLTANVNRYSTSLAKEKDTRVTLEAELKELRAGLAPTVATGRRAFAAEEQS